MIARKCDRCGKYYEPYRADNGSCARNVNGMAFVHKTISGGYSGDDDDGYDLCPECLRAAIAFIKEGKKSE